MELVQEVLAEGRNIRLSALVDDHNFEALPHGKVRETIDGRPIYEEVEAGTG